MAARLGVKPATVKSWIDGGNPKEVGNRLLHILKENPDFDARRLKPKAIARYGLTAGEWVRHLLEVFKDYRLAQFAARLGVPYATVAAWARSKQKRLKGSAEALLLYVYQNPEKFPRKTHTEIKLKSTIKTTKKLLWHR